MITYYFRTIKDTELKKIETVRNGVWIHVESPNDEEIMKIGQDLNLDSDIMEDAKDFFEVPRMERSGGITYFFTRYPFNERTEDTDTAPLLLVIGESFVLTLTQRPIPQFETFFTGKTIIYTTKKTKLFIEIMSVITLSYEKQLIALRRSVQRDRVKLQEISNKEIIKFVNYEHKLNDMVAALLPTNASLQQVLSGNYIQVFTDDRELVEDLRIDNMQVVDSARTVLKTIQNVRNSAEAILANDLNNRIKTLTALTILLTVPTIIFSLFGMNVPVPMEHYPFGFFVVILIVLALVALVIRYFRQNDWL